MVRRPTILSLPALLLLPPTASAAVESPWVSGHPRAPGSSPARWRSLSGPAALLAGVEIAMPPGWKTYWRNPGDGGGVPPTFDWSGSENLGRATVLYPAPKRLSDKGGDTIGYKGSVIFPVVLSSGQHEADLARLAFSYGVCREICIPAEAELALVVPVEGRRRARSRRGARAGATAGAGTPPRRSGARPLGRRADRGEAAPAVEAKFPSGTSDADAFVEGPEGVGLPCRRRRPARPKGVSASRSISRKSTAPS